MDEFKGKVAAAKDKTKKWCEDRYWDAKFLWINHKDEIVGAAGLVTSGVLGGIKIYDAITVRQRRKAAMRYEDRKIFYDPSTGCRYRLKRNLSNRESLELSRRKRDGENVGDILKDMRILRK